MSKWIVQLDYEFGEFEPNSIYFRRVCSDDIEYGSAYDTKREALKAFCFGQLAMDELRKEREAEQKKEEEEIKPYELSDTDDIIEASKKFAKEPSLAKYVCSVEIMKAEHGHRLDTIEAHIAKIEERLTEIEGVLSSIGSPNYDLRKKVDGLEKGLAQLTDTFYICANNETHNYEDLRKKVELIDERTKEQKKQTNYQKALLDSNTTEHQIIDSRREALEKKVEELEKRLRNY